MVTECLGLCRVVRRLAACETALRSSGVEPIMNDPDGTTTIRGHHPAPPQSSSSWPAASFGAPDNRLVEPDKSWVAPDTATEAGAASDAAEVTGFAGGVCTTDGHPAPRDVLRPRTDRAIVVVDPIPRLVANLAGDIDPGPRRQHAYPARFRAGLLADRRVAEDEEIALDRLEIRGRRGDALLDRHAVLQRRVRGIAYADVEELTGQKEELPVLSPPEDWTSASCGDMLRFCPYPPLDIFGQLLERDDVVLRILGIAHVGCAAGAVDEGLREEAATADDVGALAFGAGGDQKMAALRQSLDRLGVERALVLAARRGR